jgi:hypothetical protein
MKRLILVLALAAAAALTGLARAEPGTQSALSASSGSGTGEVSIAPTASDRPYFDVQVEVNVHGLQPTTTYTVQRAPDFNPDGVCTGATWITNGSITTSAGGSATGHYHVELGPPFVSGFRFDILFRVVGDDGAELRTACMTVTAK